MRGRAVFLSPSLPTEAPPAGGRLSHDTHAINRELRYFFRDALRISLRSPRQALFFLYTLGRQVRAARLRAAWKRQGLHVPAVMIFSITHHCNLRCKGCYAQALHPSSKGDMSRKKLGKSSTSTPSLTHCRMDSPPGITIIPPQRFLDRENSTSLINTARPMVSSRE